MLALSQETGPAAWVAGSFCLPSLAVWRPWSSGSRLAEPQSTGEVRVCLWDVHLGGPRERTGQWSLPDMAAPCRPRSLGAGLWNPWEPAAVICDLRSSCVAGVGRNISYENSFSRNFKISLPLPTPYLAFQEKQVYSANLFLFFTWLNLRCFNDVAGQVFPGSTDKCGHRPSCSLARDPMVNCS